MVRFMFVVFGLLAWAFYDLSGGSAYTPREGSLQASGFSIFSPPRDMQAGATRLAGAAPQPQGSASEPLAETAAAARPDPSTRLPTVTLPGQTTARFEAARDTPAPALAPTPATFDPEGPATTLPGLAEWTGARQQPAPPVADGSDTAQTAQAAQTAQDRGDIRMVRAERVNLRAGPGTDHGVLDQLRAGARVEVLHDPGAGWVELRVSETGLTGWMSARLLDAVN